MDPIRQEIRKQLTGPGGPFEISIEPVLGEELPVFKNRPGSLRQLLIDSAARGDTEFIVSGDWRISYAEHARLVASVATALRERYGIGKGDRVAILAANCPEWVIGCWATLSLGGIVAAMNGWWTAAEISYGVGDSDPKLLIGDRKRLQRVEGLDLGVPILDTESGFQGLLEHAPDAALPDEPIAEDDPAVILYTSGTTGRPKGAVGTHRGILGFVQTTMLTGIETLMYDARQNPQEAETRRDAGSSQQIMLATSPMFHLSGLYSMIIMHLATGGKMIIRQDSRFDPEDVLRLIEKERVTIWAPLGSMAHRTATYEGRHRFDLSSVTSIGFGGAPTSPAIQNAMRELFPSAGERLGIGYGSSESVAVLAGIRGAEYRKYPEAAGRVTPTVELEIRDPEGHAVPEGVEGEIHARSAYTMLEYWRNPEATRETIKPGRWLATGDVGRFEGELLYINSRARDMILRSAENIYPVEIEYRLDAHPAVAESAVVGVEHEELGQEVKAIVVPVEGMAVSTDELAAWCAETLAPYKVPTLWEVRADPLPRTASGKLLKNVLRGETQSSFVEE